MLCRQMFQFPFGHLVIFKSIFLTKILIFEIVHSWDFPNFTIFCYLMKQEIQNIWRMFLIALFPETFSSNFNNKTPKTMYLPFFISLINKKLEPSRDVELMSNVAKNFTSYWENKILLILVTNSWKLYFELTSTHFTQLPMQDIR